jgi:hypothetical protein
MQFLCGLPRTASSRFGGEKEVSRVSREPRLDADLGITVGARDIDVVYPMTEKKIEGSTRFFVRCRRQGGRAKDDTRAQVPGSTEGLRLDRHLLTAHYAFRDRE